MLHSPAYRAKFAEFLKIDFPRIPYPASPEVFAHVSDKGEQLRRLHLMEAPAIGDMPYPYHGEGDDVVASGYPKWEAAPSPRSPDGESPSPARGEGRAYINPDQYFDGVPGLAWAFHIGGYLEMCSILGGWWRVLRVGRIIPRGLRDWAYRLVARNRYRWFGTSGQCELLTPEQRARLFS